MSQTLQITPAGRLEWVGDSAEIATSPLETAISLTTSQRATLSAALANSNADGLLALASAQFAGNLPACLLYWRGWGRRVFEAICRLGEGTADRWATVAQPGSAEIAQALLSAPPMRGLEYLDTSLLEATWRELAQLASQRAKQHAEGPAAWLASLDPVWRLVGRVTFHLAENKRDPAHPFAFLATFTNRISGESKLQHLPLAEALKNSAQARDQSALETLLEPVRRASAQSRFVAELLESKRLFSPQALSIGQAHSFLSEAAQVEAAGVVVRLPDWWQRRRPPRPTVQVRVGQKKTDSSGPDGVLDFQVSLALDGEPLTEAERQQLLGGTEGLVLLRGKWVEVDQKRLQQALDQWKKLEKQHAQGVTFIEGMRLLSGVSLDGGTTSDAPDANWTEVTTGDWLRETLDRIRQPETIDTCRPGKNLNATLRPYQETGVRWLWFMTELGLGGCLADDMGLGKTIQVIDLLLQRQATAKGEPKPNLLVVPASLLGNWKQELARFAPGLRVRFAHNSEADAAQIAALARDPNQELAGCHLLITTYGGVRRQEWLGQVDWSLVILDEAQAIKNAGSTQTKEVKKLRAKARLVLTGTPVENNLGDLWSLFDFCCPGLLGNASQFKQFIKNLNRGQDANSYAALRRLVRPYILRRLKSDPGIAPDLPEKTEMRTECGLSRKQAALYEKTVADLKQRLEEAEGMSRRGLVLASLMQLKQICNHPAQFLGGTKFPPEESSKFERVRLLCEPIVERQEKVLVFTQFQSLTEPLAKFLAEVFGRPGLVLHGGTPVKKRSELVKTFQDPAGPPFFVISLKAGGSGLNLTAASHVIHFDRWWNPAVENQATDRAFRIGQKRNVLVHKFVCRGTLEERIDAMITSKQSLANEVLDNEGETLLTEMSNEELLKFVALDVTRATDAG
ncbi:MAG: DEAD/DEAH box helicase [Planctomycetota bacterium]|nr:DEAD/DEAH box helicase [Planctomycetota bacterium]